MTTRLSRDTKIQANLGKTDSMGPGKLIRHMQNPSNTYDTYFDMHGTGTRHIVRRSQKSVVQWSIISKFSCIKRSVEGKINLVAMIFFFKLTCGR